MWSLSWHHMAQKILQPLCLICYNNPEFCAWVEESLTQLLRAGRIALIPPPQTPIPPPQCHLPNIASPIWDLTTWRRYGGGWVNWGAVMVDSLTMSWPISLLLSPASSRKQTFNQGCRSNPLYKQINKHRLCLYIKHIMFINQFQEENNILHYI